MTMAFKTPRQRKAVMAKLSRSRPAAGLARHPTASAFMDTNDGGVEGKVTYNPAFKQYHLTIDGSQFGHFDSFDVAVEDLSLAGFKDIKIKR